MERNPCERGTIALFDNDFATCVKRTELCNDAASNIFTLRNEEMKSFAAKRREVIDALGNVD